MTMKELSKYSPETIVWINFGNIIDEMVNNKFKVCFLNGSNNVFIERNGSIFALELSSQIKPYIEWLVKHKKAAAFRYVAQSASIPQYRKEFWDIGIMANRIKSWG